jgi:hypothetical protein
MKDAVPVSGIASAPNLPFLALLYGFGPCTHLTIWQFQISIVVLQGTERPSQKERG